MSEACVGAVPSASPAAPGCAVLWLDGGLPAGGLPALAPWAAAWRACKALAAVPFDVIRHQYSSAVRAGLIRKSLLASSDFERALGALERMTLGPLARRV
ncbi:MAG: hypothetical protein ACXWKD_05360 [Caldimonas sp.]